ncbi:hypothetical protein [Actinoplanes solisilvae]|uniref:hypothetical protein n=1 Tax=Actinoplanes solisilvae TaxID=2486853 RepID=UPI000FDB1690|nr:hypothetical protein [Actinoplanes solisilvae]
MLIAAGGGGAGGTPWSLMTVKDMQTYIQNPDIPAHYELLTGWKRSADLLIEHRWQVQNYRDNLAAAWPPEKNEASAAYLARLDELIANLSDTYEAALSNHDAFAAATLSLSLAQKEMAEIAGEYEANEQSLAAFTAQQQQPASGRPQPSPSPSGEQPPVAPGRQEELHQQAVTLLSGVSADLALAQLNVRTPKPYWPNKSHDERLSGDGDGFTAPPIPPITPSFATEASASARSGRTTATFPTTPSTALPPAPQPLQPGLVLGGATPALGTSSTGGIPPLAPSVTANPVATGLLPPPVGGLAPNGGGLTLPPPVSGPHGRNQGVPRDNFARPGSSPPGAYAMPPGGIIGGIPGAGTAQPASGRPAASRINPIGGIIGTGGLPQGKTGAAGATALPAGSATPYGQTNGRSIRRQDQNEEIIWDPDNPWRTAIGVDPVLHPTRERPIDPGPAIGLP